MPWTSKPKGKPKIVRKRLADGTIKEYSYTRQIATPREKDSLALMIQGYQNSSAWRRLAPATQDKYVRYLDYLTPVWTRPASELTRTVVMRLRRPLDESARPAAANAFVRVVSALFQWGLDNEYGLETNPCARIRPLPGGHFPAWTSDGAGHAVEVLPEHLRRLVVLALYTGQRRVDLCRMAWSNYDGTRLRLTQQKTGVSLVIPVHPVLKADLDTWERKATTILVNARGRPWKPGTASHGMKLAIDRLGLPPGWNIHGLRKLAAANLAEAGCSALEIAAITGHKTLGMVALYTRGADQERMATAAIVRLQRK